MGKDKTEHERSKWTLLQLKSKKTKLKKFVFSFAFQELQRPETSNTKYSETEFVDVTKKQNKPDFHILGKKVSLFSFSRSQERIGIFMDKIPPTARKKLYG